MTQALIEGVFTALQLVALASVLGVSAARLWLMPRDAGVKSLTRSWLSAALLLILIAALVDLLVRTAALANVPIAATGPFLATVIQATHYGQLWIMAMMVLSALILVWAWQWWRGASPASDGLIAGGGGVIVLIISATGHAGETGLISLRNGINALHMISGCVWGGAVLVYATTVLPSLRRAASSGLATTAGRLSSLAAAALATVLATGLYNAWVQLPELAAFWTTVYGQVLSAKLLAVAAMMGIGAINRFFLVPAVQAGGPVTRFLTVLRMDVGIFAVVLIGAATLGMQTPPASH